MGWAWLGEYWRIVLVVVTGLLVLLRRLPRWVRAAWALLVAAVVLAWLVDMSWPGTLVLFAGMSLIASAFWLRAEERRART
ncbi:MAG: hypothetical protein ACRDSK_13870 [Actinophytocola sp.]|uniref:hypothetical protein n=1 Tax=Actinophytocola sp. TaxID=1872138 RepID=UPI003D6B1858